MRAQVIAALILPLLWLPGTGCSSSSSSSSSHASFVRLESNLSYAAESRNYPEDPDSLVVTARGGGFRVFNISGPGQFDPVAQWTTGAAVEGQDRKGDLLVVSELGLGPGSAPLPGSDGPKLHLFDFAAGGGGGGGGGAAAASTTTGAAAPSLLLPAALEPFASVDLSPFIDAVLHVKLLRPAGANEEVWAACSGGFATSVPGALVLVNLTRAVATTRSHRSSGTAATTTTTTTTTTAATTTAAAAAVALEGGEVSVLSTPVLQPEGVMVVEGAAGRTFVYIGGINSTSLGVVDVTTFAAPALVEVRENVGMQLVGARRRDQPQWGVRREVNELNELNEGEDESDDGLLFMAGWGAEGRLLVLNASRASAASPPLVAATAATAREELKLAMANRVKLVFSTGTGTGGGGGDNYDVALVPLEQPLGGFAAVDISGFGGGSSSSSSSGGGGGGATNANTATVVSVVGTAHVPLSEYAESGGATTKAYCLAVSASRHVYLFIAETAAVFVFCLDDVIGRGGSCS